MTQWMCGAWYRAPATRIGPARTFATSAAVSAVGLATAAVTRGTRGDMRAAR